MNLNSSVVDSTTGSTVHRGLSASEAQAALLRYGLNETASQSQIKPWLEFLQLLLNPLCVILVLAAAISAMAGEALAAIIIITLLLLGNVIDFIQTYRARITVNKLRAAVAMTATALRDEIWQEVPARTIVPGDVIKIAAGDMVPADGSLIDSRGLYIQEAALTGESVAAAKTTEGSHEAQTTFKDNAVYAGTSVVSGSGEVLVAATGSRTAFGAISCRLAARPPETAFDRGLRKFGYLITRMIIFLVMFTLMVSILHHRRPLDALLFSVALAVGLTPEFLPMITAVTLARGAARMAKRKVIVKQLSSIQNLGSIDILCTDKTGTITVGNMLLTRTMDPLGSNCNKPLELARINSRLQTGLRSPLDAAILQSTLLDQDRPEKLDEIPYDFERRRLSVIVRMGNTPTLITKGSPEGIFPLLQSLELDGRLVSATGAHIEKLRRLYEAESKNGFRVLAIAYKEVRPSDRYKAEDESDLILAGFLSFADPLRPETPQVIESLARDGVQVKVLTGDSDLVAEYICRSAGIVTGRVLTGSDLASMTPAALEQCAETESVFARVTPAQKLLIIEALRKRGHVVGYLGDGINDAPSLHSADVGIAVPGAVDLAKDAADIVLAEQGLKVLHEGVLEGRRAFGNVMKFLFMETSSNFGNVLSMALASAFLPFLPMLPIQILLNNFLYDVSQITIPTDHVDPQFIRKPQQWDIGLIRRFMLIVGPISSVFDIITFFVLLYVLNAGEKEFHTGWFVESLATQTLVLFVIRTRQLAWRSRPSKPLVVTIVCILVTAVVLPYSPFASILGFTPLPWRFHLFLLLAVPAYLALVEVAKGRVFPKRQPPSRHRAAAAVQL